MLIDGSSAHTGMTTAATGARLTLPMVFPAVRRRPEGWKYLYALKRTELRLARAGCAFFVGFPSADGQRLDHRSARIRHASLLSSSFSDRRGLPGGQFPSPY